VLLTFDLDFGEIMAAGGHRSPSVITFRLRNPRPERVNRWLGQLLDEQGDRLTGQVIVTVEEAGYRMRRLPIGG
jgi:predicted nuclease of predicted toxin-antitoxin system